MLTDKNSKDEIDDKINNAEKVITIGEIFYWIARSVGIILK